MLTMARILSELLDANEPLFSMALHKLEQASGGQSVDVRLTAEIVGKVHQKMRALGLDPKDTTGKELYQALFNLIKLHDGFLAKRIGISDPTDANEALPRIKATIEELDIPKHAWVLKHSVAKRLLKATPPKRVMKQLGYRSIDSFLKRENVAEVFGAIRFLETPEWQHAFVQKYKKLTPTDFETRDIAIVLLDPKRFGDAAMQHVHAKRHNVTHLKELGAIVVIPMPVAKMPGITITTLPMLIHYINEIRLYSAFFKMQQVRSDFSELLIATLIDDPADHAVMASQRIHWRVIQRYFGRVEANDHPEIFEPHVMPEDLHWRKAEEVLYRLEPALHFWHDMDYVALPHSDRPISFNLLDMAVSYVNGLTYGHQAVYHFRESLWNEIYTRYMGQPALEQQVLKQLDNERLAPELITVDMEGIF